MLLALEYTLVYPNIITVLSLKLQAISKPFEPLSRVKIDVKPCLV